MFSSFKSSFNSLYINLFLWLRIGMGGGGSSFSAVKIDKPDVGVFGISASVGRPKLLLASTKSNSPSSSSSSSTGWFARSHPVFRQRSSADFPFFGPFFEVGFGPSKVNLGKLYLVTNEDEVVVNVMSYLADRVPGRQLEYEIPRELKGSLHHFWTEVVF